MVQIAAIARQAEVDANCSLHNGGFIRYFTGTPPATIELAATGTLIAEFNLPDPAYSAAVDDGSQAVGSINPVPTTNAIASGTVSYYRTYTSGGADPGNAVKQGTITGTGGGGDMEITDPNIQNGEPLSIGTQTYTQLRGT